MTKLDAQLEWEDAIRRINRDTMFSSWLRVALRQLMARTACDRSIIHEVELLAAVLRGRSNEFLTHDPGQDPSDDGVGARLEALAFASDGAREPLAMAAEP